MIAEFTKLAIGVVLLVNLFGCDKQPTQSSAEHSATQQTATVQLPTTKAIPAKSVEPASQRSPFAASPSFKFTETLDPEPVALATGVHEGHMPWRLDPTMVAQLYIGYAFAERKIPNNLKQELTSLSDIDPEILPAEQAMQETARWETPRFKILVRLSGYKGVGNEVIWQSSGCEIFMNR
jgi:hypothetical protein